MAVKRLTLCAAWLGFACTMVAARGQETAGYQSLASVRSAAERALRREIDPALRDVELTAAALDSRLRLASCATPLQSVAQPPKGTQSRVAVRVACASGSTWSVNVPVEIRREHPVLVLRRPVARGEAVNAADVSVQKRKLAGLASPYVARLEDLRGRHARRLLAEGTAVTADALTPALLIHRGQSVTLMATSGGVEVRAPGRAMADAGANQRLRVQNLVSLKVVEGVAESGSVVRVNP
jgi:flagella basal body P-ring formation protein FlgA